MKGIKDRMKKVLLALILLGVPFISAFAIELDDDGFSKGGASYLELGTYARAVSLGKAYSSIALGAGGFFYNPAGLGYTPDLELSSMSTVLGLDRKLFGLSVVMPVIRAYEELPEVFDKEPGLMDRVFHKKKYGQFGFGMAYMDFGVSGIQGRDLRGVRTTDFDDKEKMLAVGFGYKLFQNLSVGTNLKYYRQELEKAKANAYGFDLGVLYKLFDGRFTTGFTARDLFSELSWKVPDEALGSEYTYKESIPEKYVLGFSLAFNGDKGIAAVDLNKTQNAKVWPHAGIEYRVTPMLKLRAGLDRYQPTIGFGVNLPVAARMDASIDYAFKYDVDELANMNFVNLNIYFSVLSRYILIE